MSSFVLNFGFTSKVICMLKYWYLCYIWQWAINNYASWKPGHFTTHNKLNIVSLTLKCRTDKTADFLSQSLSINIFLLYRISSSRYAKRIQFGIKRSWNGFRNFGNRPCPFLLIHPHFLLPHYRGCRMLTIRNLFLMSRYENAAFLNFNFIFISKSRKRSHFSRARKTLIPNRGELWGWRYRKGKEMEGRRETFVSRNTKMKTKTKACIHSYILVCLIKPCVEILERFKQSSISIDIIS